MPKKKKFKRRNTFLKFLYFLDEDFAKENVVECYLGAFNNHVDIISPFFDHPPTSVDIFYVLNVDKFGKF